MPQSTWDVITLFLRGSWSKLLIQSLIDLESTVNYCKKKKDSPVDSPVDAIFILK